MDVHTLQYVAVPDKPSAACVACLSTIDMGPGSSVAQWTWGGLTLGRLLLCAAYSHVACSVLHNSPAVVRQDPLQMPADK
jgi:hypothetical protein